VEAPDWTAVPFDDELSQWQRLVFGADGEVTVEDGVLHMQMGGPMTGVKYHGDAAALLGVGYENFVIEFEAMRIQGMDFFVGLTFPIGDQGHATLIMGGWGGSVVGLSSLGYDDASSNETTNFIQFDQDRWYAVRLEVSAAHVTCSLDGNELFSVERAKYEQFTLRGEVLDTAPLGLCCYQTHAAVRNMRIRQYE